MRKVALFCLLAVLPVVALGQNAEPKKASVLVVYYSAKGHTKAMAVAVVKGAKSVEGVEVKLLSVAEAKPDDVLASDAVIVGSPVYKANVAPPMQEFINSWPVNDPKLHDKIGAAFVTGSGISGGEELVQMSLIHSMLVCQMIIVGGPDTRQPFGASAITGENPSEKKDEKKSEEIVSPYYLKKGEALGKRVAELALKVKIGQERKP